MRKIATFALGVVVGGVLFSGVAVGAANYLKASVYNVKIVVDNKEAKLTDQPLNVNGKTYLPLRDTANVLGYGVSSVTSSKIELKSEGTSTSMPRNPNIGKTNKNNNSGNTATEPNSSKGEYVKDLESKFSTDGKIDANKVKLAIAAGEISVNAQDEATGNSLLHYAVIQDNYALYQVIHVNALNPNLQNKDGQTPLHLAVINENRFYFGELTGDLKADATIKDNSNKRPIDYAGKDSTIEVVLKIYMM